VQAKRCLVIRCGRCGAHCPQQHHWAVVHQVGVTGQGRLGGEVLKVRGEVACGRGVAGGVPGVIVRAHVSRLSGVVAEHPSEARVVCIHAGGGHQCTPLIAAPHWNLRVGEVSLVDAQIMKERQRDVGDQHEGAHNASNDIFVVVPALPVGVLSTTTTLVFELDAIESAATEKILPSSQRRAAIDGKDTLTSPRHVAKNRRLEVGDVAVREPQTMHDFMHACAHHLSERSGGVVHEIPRGEVRTSNNGAIVAPIKLTVASPCDCLSRSRRGRDIEDIVCIRDTGGRVACWDGVLTAHGRTTNHEVANNRIHLESFIQKGHCLWKDLIDKNLLLGGCQNVV
jgi:hypothetical protein